MVRRAPVCLLCVLAGLGLARSGAAGGLLAQELGNPRNGVAQAGQAAYAYDAATAFYNPAGMARIKEPRLLVGLQAIYADIEFDVGSQTTFTGGDGDDQGGVIPGLGTFYVRPLTDRWAIGGSIAALAGGALSPDSDWAGRFFVTELDLVALGLNPVVSFRVNDWLSIGGGFSINYGRLDMELHLPRIGNVLDQDAIRGRAQGVGDTVRRAVAEAALAGLGEVVDERALLFANFPDFFGAVRRIEPRDSKRGELPENLSRWAASLSPEMREQLSDRIAQELRSSLGELSSRARAALEPRINEIARAASLLEPGPEGQVEIGHADDIAFSWNVGVLIEPNERTRFGVTYRSKIDFDLEGDLEVKNTPPLFAALGLSDGDVAAEIPIPQLVRASIYHQLTDTVAIMGDVGWEDWSEMDFTPITGPSGATVQIPRGWHDTWHFALGVEWRAHPRWLLQTGVAHDTSPVRDRRHNMPDMPADRQWRFSTGFVYDWSESIQIGLNYTYADYGSAPVDVTNAFGRLQGDYEDYALHAVALSVEF